MGYGLDSYGQGTTVYGGEKMKPEYIILHHSLTKDSKTVSWSAIRRYHTSYKYRGRILTKAKALKMKSEGIRGIASPWRAIGYHMGLELINDRHEILTGRMMNETGAHCYQSRMNHRSLGIMFMGNFDNEKPPKEQWNLGLKLVSSLMDVFKISKDNVFGHNHFAKYKTCPGKLFDVDEFINQLKVNS